MKNFIYLLFLVLLTSCQHKINDSDIVKLNGYWEIEKVVFSNGFIKEYPSNESFDYIQIKDKSGFRKKVIPQFNGRFLTSKQIEKLQLVNENDKVYLLYNTPFAQWKEEIKSISTDKLVVVTAANTTYYYKKTGPINLNEDGKTTQ